MTCPRIGVSKLDPSVGRCLALTTLEEGGYAVTIDQITGFSLAAISQVTCPRMVHKGGA